MKRILYLASFDIGKRTGGGLASLCYYNALCSLYPGQVDLMMNEECCVGKYENAIKIPPRHWYEYITDFSLHRGKRFILKYIKEHASQYSVCVINCSRYGGDMMNAIHKLGLKIVMIHHNYEVEYCMDNKYIITLKGLFPGIVASYEKSAYKKADVNCYLTSSDLELIKAAYGDSKAKDYILGVFDSSTQSYTLLPGPTDNSIVVSGAMNDYQTYHSLELFEKDYFQILKNKFSNFRLIITGRNPHTSIYRFQSSNPDYIEIVANPVDINEVINRGCIFFCPTCLGGGLKLRVMDGLKLGLPVLVHSVSARGYEYLWNEPFFQVYDSKESFKKGLDIIVNYINSNPGYKEKIVSKYQEYFGFEAGVSRIKKIMDSV